MTNHNLNQDATKSASDIFSKLLQSLRDAIVDFQSETTPENFGKIVTAVGAYGASGSKLWKDVSAFARKHPLQTAVGAGVAFFVLKGILARSTVNEQNENAPEWRMQNYH